MSESAESLRAKLDRLREATKPIMEWLDGKQLSILGTEFDEMKAAYEASEPERATT